jgi:hypothetical protein
MCVEEGEKKPKKKQSNLRMIINVKGIKKGIKCWN